MPQKKKRNTSRKNSSSLSSLKISPLKLILIFIVAILTILFLGRYLSDKGRFSKSECQSAQIIERSQNSWLCWMDRKNRPYTWVKYQCFNGYTGQIDGKELGFPDGCGGDVSFLYEAKRICESKFGLCSGPTATPPHVGATLTPTPTLNPKYNVTPTPTSRPLPTPTEATCKFGYFTLPCHYLTPGVPKNPPTPTPNKPYNNPYGGGAGSGSGSKGVGAPCVYQSLQDCAKSCNGSCAYCGSGLYQYRCNQE